MSLDLSVATQIGTCLFFLTILTMVILAVISYCIGIKIEQKED
jgi:hypothetical protein